MTDADRRERLAVIRECLERFCRAHGVEFAARGEVIAVYEPGERDVLGYIGSVP